MLIAIGIQTVNSANASSKLNGFLSEQLIGKTKKQFSENSLSNTFSVVPQQEIITEEETSTQDFDVRLLL